VGRGYAPSELDRQLRQRQISPRISKPRRAPPAESPPAPRPAKSGAANDDGSKYPTSQARHRWPVERTNGWLKAKRRIATRRDRKADNDLAFLHLGMILILANSF